MLKSVKNQKTTKTSRQSVAVNFTIKKEHSPLLKRIIKQLSHAKEKKQDTPLTKSKLTNKKQKPISEKSNLPVTAQNSHHYFAWMHRITFGMIIDELLFIAGILIFIFGYQQFVWSYILSGLVIMAIAVLLLFMGKGEDPIDRIHKAEDSEEIALLKQIDQVLKKEKELKVKEKQFALHIEHLYLHATQLAQKEEMLNKQALALAALQKKGPQTKPEAVVEKSKEKAPKKKWWSFSKKEQSMEEEVRRLLKIMDSLLEKLPEHEVEKFSQSEDFQLYKKVIEKL